MTTAFVDTSCFVALALRERASDAVRRRLARFDLLAASPLLEAELRAVDRREGLEVETPLTSWLGAVRWVVADRTLSQEIDTVLSAGCVRGADCWHLATALYLSPDQSEITFLTLDERQAEVAKALGFRR